jgi:COX assembly protein 2
MVALEECHAKGFMWKAMGMCNGEKEALSKCLKAERVKMQNANRSSRSEKKEKIKQIWKEIDENS